VSDPAVRDPVYLIVNERAGRGRGALAGTQAHEALTRRGVRVERRTTRGAGDATELARAARAEGAAVVAAVGGDGTLHEVLNGLLGDDLLAAGAAPRSPVPLLGSIPVGSGNDYVKMLGVSRTDPRQAAVALLDGPARPVDVGVLEGAAPRDGKEARGELFLNNLGLAFTGAANAQIESTRGLPLAYFLGAAKAFFFYESPLTEVEVDGRTLYTGHPTIIHINLGRYCGGGVIFTPDALLDDGLFDVLIAAEMTRLDCIIRWNAVTSGKYRELADCCVLRGANIVVRSPPGSLLHADGEVRKFVGDEVVARLVPGPIRVIHAPAPVPDVVLLGGGVQHAVR
jgi:diacylglycerol kinase (ATP)